MNKLHAQQRAERLVRKWWPILKGKTTLSLLIAAELLAVQRETREACAALCDSLGADDTKPTDRVIGYEECADAIRGESHE